MKQFITDRHEGCPQLAPVIKSIKDFYSEAFNADDRVVKILSSNEVRKELFKLFYDSGVYSLNDKADANEAFVELLNLIHGWEASSAKHKDMFSAVNQKCKGCFVHEAFYQSQIS